MWIFVCLALSLFTADVWASPVPDTGQSECYNAMAAIPCPSSGQPFFGQDAQYTINPMSYTKLDGSGNVLSDSATSWVMVKDNVTGLVWEMKTNMDGVQNYSNPHDADNTYTWYDSNPATNGGYAGTAGSGTNTEGFVKALNDANYGGYSNWRMPNSKELSSIVNYGIPYPGPTIDTGYFQNTAASWYWSSTTDVSYTSSAWGVYFDYGIVYGNYKGYAGYVRAVRGGQSVSSDHLAIGSFDTVNSRPSEGAATGSYIDNGDGTVTDTSTGLMWQQAGFSNTQTWEQALAYCEGLNLGGYTDWRLPTSKELQSLVDYSRYSLAINETYFPNEVASWYWSSTTYADYTNYAWLVHFGYGYDYVSDKSYRNYVRAVRWGQSGLLGNLVVSPVSRYVAKDAGTTTFSVSNTGTGTMLWSAAVTPVRSWLTISPASGTNAGTISCNFTTNTSTLTRAATIQVTATGTTGSPRDVMVTQAPTPTRAPTPPPVPTPRPSPHPSPSPSPSPSIQANGQNGSISVTANVTPVSITISLDPGGKNGKNADWWLAYSSPAGWYSLTANGWIPGINLLFKYPLFSMSPTVIFSSTLPFGDYAFYFLVDMRSNDVIDSPFYYGLVEAHVMVHVINPTLTPTPTPTPTSTSKTSVSDTGQTICYGVPGNVITRPSPD